MCKSGASGHEEHLGTIVIDVQERHVVIAEGKRLGQSGAQIKLQQTCSVAPTRLPILGFSNLIDITILLLSLVFLHHHQVIGSG